MRSRDNYLLFLSVSGVSSGRGNFSVHWVAWIDERAGSVENIALAIASFLNP